jgi:hypothetical protein
MIRLEPTPRDTISPAPLDSHDRYSYTYATPVSSFPFQDRLIHAPKIFTHDRTPPCIPRAETDAVHYPPRIVAIWLSTILLAGHSCSANLSETPVSSRPSAPCFVDRRTTGQNADQASTCSTLPQDAQKGRPARPQRVKTGDVPSGVR